MLQRIGKDLGKKRTTLRLNSKLDRSLAAYMTAATAAGVGLLAATNAEAKIVYTPADQILVFHGNDSQMPFDINGDGIPDILFTWGTVGYGSYVGASPEAGNGIVGAPGSAAALPWGTRIGPKDAFVTTAELMMERAGCHSKCSTFGPWAGKYNRFLGVKFTIGGETHYGWVNLNMTRGSGTITGYAYETIPNKPLVAGEKTESTGASLSMGEQLSPSPQPATLGLLARGADGIAIWRRDDEVAVR